MALNGAKVFSRFIRHRLLYAKIVNKVTKIHKLMDRPSCFVKEQPLKGNTH